MRVTSLDPGGTTGVAQYRDGTITTHSLTGDRHHLELWCDLLVFGPDVVISERYEYQIRPGAVSVDLIAREYIGVADVFTKIKSSKQRPVEFVLQPTSCKQFWDDSKLKKVSLWVSSKHERDATRHLLYYLTSQGDHTWVNRLRG